MTRVLRLALFVAISLALVLTSRLFTALSVTEDLIPESAEIDAFSERLVSQSTQPQNNDEEQKPLFIFGYSADAPPISSDGGQGVKEPSANTLCGALYQEIKDAYDIDYKIRAVDLDSSERFKGFEDSDSIGKIDFSRSNLGVECGPNSKTKERSLSLESKNGGN